MKTTQLFFIVSIVLGMVTLVSVSMNAFNPDGPILIGRGIQTVVFAILSLTAAILSKN